MEKNMIDKIALCAENSENSLQYENLAMQILSKSTNKTNVFAITSDSNKRNALSTIGLNIGYNLAYHGKKVLLINMDIANMALNNLLGSQNDNETKIEYGKIDIILPTSIDFIGNLDMQGLKDKYSDYNFVILVVPSPKYSCNYLAVPQQTEYYLVVTKYSSSFYSLNSCIKKITAANSVVCAGVYLRFKKKKQ